MSNEVEAVDRDTLHRQMAFYWACGFDLDVTEDDENSKYSFTTTTKNSFRFEALLGFLYLLNLWCMSGKTSKMRKLRAKRMNVVMIKNYELKRLYGSDSEGDDGEGMAGAGNTSFINQR